MQELYALFIEAFQANPVGQGVGIIAFLITMYAFGLCKDRKFIIVIMISGLFWGSHFAYLSAFAAAGVHLFDIVKNALALKYEKNNYITAFCVLAYMVIGFFTYKDVYSIIPIITSLISVGLVFYVRGVWLNAGYLGIIICWFGYNLHNGSIGGVASDIILFFVGIGGIIRILLTQKKGKV